MRGKKVTVEALLRADDIREFIGNFPMEPGDIRKLIVVIEDSDGFIHLHFNSATSLVEAMGLLEFGKSYLLKEVQK